MNRLRVVQRRNRDDNIVYGPRTYIIERRLDASQMWWNDDYPWQSVYILLERDGYTLAAAMDFARRRHDELVRPL